MPKEVRDSTECGESSPRRVKDFSCPTAERRLGSIRGVDDFGVRVSLQHPFSSTERTIKFKHLEDLKDMKKRKLNMLGMY